MTLHCCFIIISLRNIDNLVIFTLVQLLICFLFQMMPNSSSLFRVASPNMDVPTTTYAPPRANFSAHEYACFEMLHQDDDVILTTYIIFVYTSTCLVFLGLAGNTLSFIVFSSGELKELPTTVHMLMLSLSDSAYLLCVFFTKILTTLRCLHLPESYIDFFNRDAVSCKTLQLLLDVFNDLSSCLILIFTVERFISIRFPVLYRESFTIKRARIAGVVCLVFITLCIAPYHMMFIGRPYGYDVCSVLPYRAQLFTVLYMTEATVFRIVPVFVIAVLNVGIATNVKRFTTRHLRRQMSVRTRHRETKNNQLNVLLLLVSTSYIVMYLPELVHFVLWRLDIDGIISVAERPMSMLHSFSRILYISGFAINFVLYTIGCKVFREQLKSIICSRWKMLCKAAGARGRFPTVEMQLI